MRKFENALPFSTDMVIPGFEKSYPKGIFKTLALSPIDSKEWYHSFIERLDSAIGHHYLPVCRLSDGEFIFSLGRNFLPVRGAAETMLSYWHRMIHFEIVRLLRSDLRKYRGGVDSSIPSGVFTNKEWEKGRNSYGFLLNEISRIGILGLHFSYRDNQFAQQYFVPMVKWLKSHNIQLTTDNYYPFYFTYALLNGPDRARILGREKILVVTHCNDDKATQIELNLKKEGAKSVQFLQISQNRSLYDKLDLNKVRLPVDVVLIGAGIGKPNILLQLKATNTLCIDAGFNIECIANPEFRRSKAGARTFTWPDFERNGDYSPI